MEQNRDLRNKLMCIWSVNLTKVPRIYEGERMVSSISGVGKTGYLHAKRKKK